MNLEDTCSFHTSRVFCAPSLVFQIFLFKVRLLVFGVMNFKFVHFGGVFLTLLFVIFLAVIFIDLIKLSHFLHILDDCRMIYLLNETIFHSLYRGSYMSAHVLLILLNELGKRDKMRGLPKTCENFKTFPYFMQRYGRHYVSRKSVNH